MVRDAMRRSSLIILPALTRIHSGSPDAQMLSSPIISYKIVRGRVFSLERDSLAVRKLATFLPLTLSITQSHQTMDNCITDLILTVRPMVLRSITPFLRLAWNQ